MKSTFTKTLISVEVAHFTNHDNKKLNRKNKMVNLL